MARVQAATLYRALVGTLIIWLGVFAIAKGDYNDLVTPSSHPSSLHDIEQGIVRHNDRESSKVLKPVTIDREDDGVSRFLKPRKDRTVGYKLFPRFPPFDWECQQRKNGNVSYRGSDHTLDKMCRGKNRYLQYCLHGTSGLPYIELNFRCQPDEFCETIDKVTWEVYDPRADYITGQILTIVCVSEVDEQVDVLPRYGPPKVWSSLPIRIIPRVKIVFGHLMLSGDLADANFSLEFKYGINSPVIDKSIALKSFGTGKDLQPATGTMHTLQVGLNIPDKLAEAVIRFQAIVNMQTSHAQTVLITMAVGFASGIKKNWTRLE